MCKIVLKRDLILIKGSSKMAWFLLTVPFFVLEFLSNGILQISSIIHTKYNYNIAGNIIRMEIIRLRMMHAAGD